MATSSILVLLVNLGSPQQITFRSIYQFLSQFLSDKRVVNLPPWLWKPLLLGIILPWRVVKLMAKYKLIWLVSGSPLIYYTQRQAQKLKDRFTQAGYSNFQIAYAFCYGSTTIEQQLTKLNKPQPFTQLVVIPLYPQYSSSTTAAIFDKVTSYYRLTYQIPQFKFIRSFAAHPKYIQALVTNISHFWHKHGRGACLVISFHGLPWQLIKQGDIYLEECRLTYTLLCRILNLTPEQDVKLSFQSRFGWAKWLTPDTATTLIQLAQQKIATVDIICPGFVTDCLETLDEVAVQYRQMFLQQGGQQLNYIPCLNEHDLFIDVLYELCQGETVCVA